MRKLTLILLCILTVTGVAAQGKIDRSKKALNNNTSTDFPPLNANTTATTSSNDSNAGVIGYLVATLFMYTVGGVAYYGLIGDYKNEEHLYNDLTQYPYLEGASGNFYKLKENEASVYVFRIDFDGKFIYSNNDLFGTHLEARIRPLPAFYLKADYYKIFEFNKAAGTRDELSLYYFNFAYDRIRLERFNLGWTLGASYAGSGIDKGGFSFGANAEYFLKNRISFGAGAKWSYINSEPVHAYEFETKFHRNKYFFGVGFEHLKIASPQYNFITLGGGLYF